MRATAAAFALGLFLSASGVSAGEAYSAANGFAVSGYDVVAYFALPQSEVGTQQPAAVPGRADITAEYNGATYAFANTGNRDTFLADPERYAPQYDGHCAFGVATGGKVPGNPNLWRIVDGKLYLNINGYVAELWATDIPGNLRMSEANWAKLDALPASTDPIPSFTPAAPVK